ncbi:MAG: hypothetical protein MZV63_58580 [Marinilabiliales bacterium]|nr:hypothetical protein [Marinilabiliales bacterium]
MAALLLYLLAERVRHGARPAAGAAAGGRHRDAGQVGRHPPRRGRAEGVGRPGPGQDDRLEARPDPPGRLGARDRAVRAGLRPRAGPPRRPGRRRCGADTLVAEMMSIGAGVPGRRNPGASSGRGRWP